MTASCRNQPVSDCSSGHFKLGCHEAVGPSSRCRLGWPILAANLPTIRQFESARPGSLATDNASYPQLAGPVLLLYSPFILQPLLVLPQQGGPRCRPYRPDSRCPLPSRIGLMQMQLSGHSSDLRSQGGVHALPLSRSSASSACCLGPVSAALSSLKGHGQTSTRTHCHRETSLGHHWQPALSSAVVLPRLDLVAGAGVSKPFW